MRIIISLFLVTLSINSMSQGENSDGQEVFTQVETMPEYPGGMARLYKFIGDSLVYPKAAQESGVHGTVVVSFIVDTNGKVQEPTVVKSGGSLLDEAAVEVISKMPEWTPGTQDGKAVNVKYNLPVSFELQETEKLDE